jgi:hypothetical protein
MFSMILASVPIAASEGFLDDGGVANGTSSAITGVSTSAAANRPADKRFAAAVADDLSPVIDIEAVP